MKLCILEDHKPHKDHLLQLLHKWELEHETPLQIDCFSNGKSLLAADVFDYDLIFLDIRLADMTGLQAAQALRARGFSHDLVFLTAYREYVFEGYHVQALNYLIKPADYAKLDACLTHVQEKTKTACYSYTYRNAVVQIPYRDIQYIESSGHHIDIVTTDRTLSQTISFKSVVRQLPGHFIQCHRTLIVNLYHVQKLDGKELSLKGGAVLPVSNTYLEPVREAFLQLLKMNTNDFVL